MVINLSETRERKCFVSSAGLEGGWEPFPTWYWLSSLFRNERIEFEILLVSRGERGLIYLNPSQHGRYY